MKSPERGSAPVRRIVRDGQIPPPPPPGRDGAGNADVGLPFDDNRLTSLVLGQFDQNLAKIERRLGIRATANGNHIALRGPAEACDHARRVLELLYERVKGGASLGLGDVDGAIEEGIVQGTLFPKESDPERSAFDEIRTRKRGGVRA